MLNGSLNADTCQKATFVTIVKCSTHTVSYCQRQAPETALTFDGFFGVQSGCQHKTNYCPHGLQTISLSGIHLYCLLAGESKGPRTIDSSRASLFCCLPPVEQQGRAALLED